jgi:hypothetical protein
MERQMTDDLDEPGYKEFGMLPPPDNLPPDYQQLEATIAELIKRKYALPEDSAERALVMRQLTGLANTREFAQPLIEELDPDGWADHCCQPAVECPQATVLPLRKPVSDRR